jgi:hypothetical protein
MTTNKWLQTNRVTTEAKENEIDLDAPYEHLEDYAECGYRVLQLKMPDGHYRVTGWIPNGRERVFVRLRKIEEDAA